MNKEFITYEQALALKELGFDEECIANYTPYFSQSGWRLIIDTEERHFTNRTLQIGFSAPLYQQAFRWFREKYRTYPHIVFLEKGWHWDVYHLDRGLVTQPELKYHHFYEEAELACLKKLIELVKQKQLLTDIMEADQKDGLYDNENEGGNK